MNIMNYLHYLHKEIYGFPMVLAYKDLDRVETENYILRKQEFRYPKNVIELYKGGCIPGDYVVLYSKQRQAVVMSDTPMERFTNQSLLANATGDVCILGLGIGMVILYLLEEKASREFDDYFEEYGIKPLKSITVIEKDKELIDLIEPLIRNSLHFKQSDVELNIINADAYEYPKNCDKHFDLVYADIWDEYHGYEDEIDVFDELEALYSPICEKFDGWGYADAHGNNPEDLSPIERKEFSHWTARMLNHYQDYDMISQELWDNILQYAEA